MAESPLGVSLWSHPRRSGQAVEHVPPERVTFRESGIVEIAGGIVVHSDFLHHTPRPEIPRHSKRDDLVKRERLESILQDCAGAFGCESAIPVRRVKTPADL